MSMAATGFKAILEDAGLKRNEIEYLEARGVSNVKLMARMAKTEDEFEEVIVEPSLTGKTIKGKKHKAS